MQTSQPEIVTDHVKICAAIGHICLQWALLEQAVLALIAAAENMPMPKVHRIFGGLDMRLRLAMAIDLARLAKWPLPLIQRIESVRKALQKGENLTERRNQAVHGVHSASEISEHVRLTMVRWGGPKKTQDVPLAELHQLGARLNELSEESWSIFEDYGAWKFKTSGHEDAGEQLGKSNSNAWLLLTQNIKGALKRLFR